MRTTFTNPDLQARFNRSGYAVLPMLSTASAARLSVAVDDLHPADGFDPGKNDPNARETYHFSFMDRDPSYKRRVHELISEVFRPLLSRYLADYRILMTNIVVKPPGTGEVCIHMNWPCVTDLDDTTVTIWVPLIDVTATNGAIHVIDGSHKILPHVETARAAPYFHDIRPSLAEYLTPVPMVAGEGLFLDDSLIHWSAVNTSPERRIAVQIICIPNDAIPAFWVKDGEDRFELVAADTDFYLDQDIEELYEPQPTWQSLGSAPSRNRSVDAREFASLMAHRNEIRAAGCLAPMAPNSPGRVHRLLAKIGL